MTRTPPPKPQRPILPSSPPHGQSGSDEVLAAKPYEFIPFPQKPLRLTSPAGHDQYLPNHLHGRLFLTLTVETAMHISTGVVVMGSDIGNNRIPLIKTMVQDGDQKLSIQGSSLKGCIRSVYEAITNSKLAVINTKKEYTELNKKIPKERRPCTDKEKLCPASRVFGALNWQGLIHFTDGRCKQISSIGFMPSLHEPKPRPKNKATGERFFNPEYFDGSGNVKGRKFYYQFIQAIDRGENKGIPVQQAGKEYVFTTQIRFRNLKPEELGALLIVLGQDSQYPIALKVGGGKPIGMGTMTVTVNAIDRIEGKQSLRDRYTSYTLSESEYLTGEALQQFMQKQIKAAHTSKLIEKPQINALLGVLRYPTDREPPAGMY